MNRYNLPDIQDTLKVLFESGDVVEVRILQTSSGTVSGYFDDMDKLADAVLPWSGKAPAVYVTINPVSHDLLARAINRLKQYVKNTSADIDIIKRRWLGLDFDPIRPTGVSSTDDEHDEALVRAIDCKKFLCEFGFSDSSIILADSGNGAHILIRVDLPNDEESKQLIDRFLESIAFRFSDDKVKVDQSVSNASRIWKLYGTMASKGDSTEDRPHRLSRLLSVPDHLASASNELVERLAAMARERTEFKGDTHKKANEFDLDAWIKINHLSVLGPHQWQDGKKWIFPVCPWNPEHTNRAAYIVQQPNGAIGAGCHHAGCNNKRWHDLRDVVEPGWRHRQTNHNSGGEGANEQDQEKKHNPWSNAKDAPTLLNEVDKEFRGLAKDILAPGAVTLIAAPRGLGKTQVSHAIAVALATGGSFRGEKVQSVRVLLLDRDNPKPTVKKRLRSWGAISAQNLRVLTREEAPDLQDKAWETFPIDDYEVLIIDSVGSSTEGVTEKEGKETTNILATVLDVARKGIAVLLLTNCTKDALTLKGRGEWADRVDILYEVRDATGFIPFGKKSWWQELPEAGESAWADRAARRNQRIDYRLAFIASKFRLGQEPEPFCLQLDLPDGAPWMLTDVTSSVVQAGEEAVEQAKKKVEDEKEKAALALVEHLREQLSDSAPILKTDGEKFLTEFGLKRDKARAVLTEKNGTLWRFEKISGKGSPIGLFPISPTEFQ